jgi:hypothetical protein
MRPALAVRQLVASRRRFAAARCRLRSVAAAAGAAQPAPPASASAADAEYAKTIADALREYRLGNWEEATAMFTRAHALRPSARTLRGMGLSEFENRKYASALVHCSAALADARNPLNPEQRSELERVIARASEFVARVALTLQPAGADVRVDGGPPQRDAAGQLLLDPGPHELVVSDGRRVERRRLVAGSGQTLALAIALQPEASAPKSGVAVAADASADQPVAARVLTYAGFALLGVGVAVGATTGAIVLSKASDLEDACRDDLCPPAQREELEQSNDLAVVANVAFAVAGVGAAAAVTGLLLEHGASDPQESAGVRVSLQPLGAALHGRF